MNLNKKPVGKRGNLRKPVSLILIPSGLFLRNYLAGRALITLQVLWELLQLFYFEKLLYSFFTVCRKEQKKKHNFVNACP
ncbi:MAG: hypothetical protein ACJARP_002203 [Vicingaceae bacterium]|jgi:hypothetical protein